MAGFSLRKIDKHLRTLKGHYTDQELEAITKHAAVVTIPPGKTLFEQGKPGEEMAIIITGQAKVTVGSQIITVLEGGAVVGEGAALTGEARSASVIASSTLHLAVLSREQMIAAIEESPDFRTRISAAIDRAA